MTYIIAISEVFFTLLTWIDKILNLSFVEGAAIRIKRILWASDRSKQALFDALLPYWVLIWFVWESFLFFLLLILWGVWIVWILLANVFIWTQFHEFFLLPISFFIFSFFVFNVLLLKIYRHFGVKISLIYDDFMTLQLFFDFVLLLKLHFFLYFFFTIYDHDVLVFILAFLSWLWSVVPKHGTLIKLGPILSFIILL